MRWQWLQYQNCIGEGNVYTVYRVLHLRYSNVDNVISSMQCLDLDVYEVHVATIFKREDNVCSLAILPCFVPPYHHFQMGNIYLS